jgi:hypothetical protein
MKTNLEYRANTVEELKLILTQDRIYDSSSLTVIETEKIIFDEFSLSLNIIGQSHWIELITDEGNFTEILACINTPQNDKYSVCGVDKLRNFSFEKKIFSKFIYSCQTWIFDANLRVQEKIEKRVGKSFSKKDYLFLSAVYPKSKISSIKICPLTTIECRKNEFGANIDTLHLYPDESRIVYSSSLIRRN